MSFQEEPDFLEEPSFIEGSRTLRSGMYWTPNAPGPMQNDAPLVAENGKRVFVTVGATAPFNALIRACLAHGFLQALKDNNYTELRFQYGENGARILQEVDLANIKSTYGIEVTGFDFKLKTLMWEIVAVRNDNVEREGALITHAGAGTVTESLRYAIPIIAVPNPDLLHNHQVELAEELARLNYVVHGKFEDLPAAITEVETFRRRMRQWPPPTSKGEDEKTKKGLKGIMDEEMGWEG